MGRIVVSTATSVGATDLTLLDACRIEGTSSVLLRCAVGG